MQSWEFPLDSSSVSNRVWFHRRKESDRWTPLRKCDCEALSNAANSGSVLIESCRATADLKTMTIKDNFMDGACRQLTSAIWYERRYISEEDYNLDPVLPRDEKRIEDLYLRAMEAYQSLDDQHDDFYKIMKEDVTIGELGEYKAFLSRDGNKICMNKRKNALVTLEAPIELQRGYETYEVEGEKEETSLGQVGHLIFVIHGIGEAMWKRDDVRVTSLRETVEKLRRTVHKKQYDAWKQRNPHSTPPKKIEFIPIEWYDSIHSSASALKNSLLAATIQTIPNLRTVANDVVFDVLMYMTPEFSEKVLSCVTDQICKHYERFLSINTYFAEDGGLCSLVGHSLGSVIAWDMLCLLQGNDSSHETWKGELDANSSILNVVQKYWNTSMTELGILDKDSSLKERPDQSSAREDGEEKADKKGSWGPLLPTKISKTIPFVPSFTLFLGSPLGLFLTLRGARVVFDNMRKEAESLGVQTIDRGDNGEILESSSPFVLPSRAIYNIFHPSDPVAYRIEPLLIPPETPNEELPTPVFLVPKGKEMKFHLKAQEMVKSIFNDLGSLVQKIPLISLDEPKRAKTAYKFALGGKSDRIDFQLQPNALENEYLSALIAHTSYFSNEDLIDFMIECAEIK